MSDRIKGNCLTPLCKNLTEGNYCDNCRALKQAYQSIKRLDYKQRYAVKLEDKGLKTNFYSSRQWRTLRRWFLNGNPLCNICGAIATQVDHITPIMNGGEALDQENLQALCARCHSLKTRAENTKE
jgi:5-methylcytosine-specific restriction endonuclease McrA